MRLFDLILSFFALLFLSPFLIIVGLLVRLSSPGPILHRAQRVGLNGHTFTLYKFRTMVLGADRQGPGITAAGDQRITPTGRLLRRYKLDELPQLVNVLKGEMSIVGPRPEDPRYVALYTPAQRRILSVRPGITSAASLAYRHEEHILSGQDWETIYRTEVLPAKLAIDLNYLARRTLWTDIGLLLQTAAALFTHPDPP